MSNNELWNLFKQAVLAKDPMQFNIYSLYRAVEEIDEVEKNENVINDDELVM